MENPTPTLDQARSITRSRGLRLFVLALTLLASSAAPAQQIHFLEHHTGSANDNSLVQVDADTYALAYRGSGGFIKTFTISADGLTITEIQSLEHDTLGGWSNSLVQVDADTYALAYARTGGGGFIKTFTIPADGLTITEIQSLEHDTLGGFHNSLVQVDADTYALAYQGEESGLDGRGFVKTFNIPADGLTITEIQSLEHDPLSPGHNSLVQVDADTYALAYRGSGGFIKTFTISADGLTITEIQSLEHDSLVATYNSLVQVDADTYALAYEGIGGFIKTFTIPSDGSTITEVQSLEHDTERSAFNSLVQVDADTYALAYAGDGLDGFLKIFTIPADGSTITETDFIEHATLDAFHNSLVQVDADTYALAYQRVSVSGFIKTFLIEADGFGPAMFTDGFESGDTMAWQDGL